MGSSKKSSDNAVAAAQPVDPAQQLQMFEALNKTTSTNTEQQLTDLQDQLKKLRGNMTPGLLSDARLGMTDMRQQLASNLMRMFGGA
jgi:hypothetical protein